ncbi:MAG: hypothetical protein V3T88_09170 [Nitrosomonadaceae bacterium]
MPEINDEFLMYASTAVCMLAMFAFTYYTHKDLRAKADEIEGLREQAEEHYQRIEFLSRSWDKSLYEKHELQNRASRAIRRAGTKHPNSTVLGMVRILVGG